MAKKRLGYARLQWTCPFCETRNPGPAKFCTGCGSPQPEDVTFEQPAQETLITDEAEIEQAKAGPDVYCPFCNARNPAGSKFCGACGADLSEGKQRERGRVVGAFRSEKAPDINCPACQSPNPPDASRCQSCGAPLGEATPAASAAVEKRAAGSGRRRGALRIGLAILALGVLAALLFFTLSTRDLVGTVEAARWERSIGVEAMVPVEQEDWRQEIPVGAEIGACQDKLHHVEQEPVAGALEVCGTPYSVDLGNGYSEVVQDCEYEVYQEWCTYTALQWQEVDRVKAAGEGFAAAWPTLQLEAEQREGSREETYQVIFSTDDGTFTLTTHDPQEYVTFSIGSKWSLKVNRLGAVTDAQPMP